MAQDEGKVAAEQPEETAPPKWTIMIYLAGDNNLSANSIAIMQELEAATSHNDVRVLACFDSNTPRPQGSRYLEINRRRHLRDTGMAWGLHNDLVVPDERGHQTSAPDFCNPDLSVVRVHEEPVAAEGLARFLEFAMKEHKAQKHMLILFGHGTAVAGQTFLVDNNPPSFLRLEELGRILGEHFGGKGQNKLDILACNNCVMNGIETAYEVRNQVELMIGSQGLMLAVGWPYRKIIEAVVRHRDDFPDIVADEILKVCARNLLDFALMDRSLEQSVCDLSKFGDDGNIITTVKRLAEVLQQGLKTGEMGELVYPQICDSVKLARLEAQTFWNEMFVDLYDFCELLLERCKEVVTRQDCLLQSLEIGDRKDAALKQLEGHPVVTLLNEIAKSCRDVLGDLEGAAPRAYYIGSELQYSHGLSVYFPWTLPEETFFFEPVEVPGVGGGGAKNFKLKTMFDIYKNYSFAKSEVSGWADFLVSFFRATLRDVRRFDKKYNESDDLRTLNFTSTNKENAFPVTLQKSSSDVDREGDSLSIKIKNYPRRNYLSPADCRRKAEGATGEARASEFSLDDAVSYLGWNVRGIVAEVIKPSKPGPRPAGNTTSGSEPAPRKPVDSAEAEPPS